MLGSMLGYANLGNFHFLGVQVVVHEVSHDFPRVIASQKTGLQLCCWKRKEMDQNSQDAVL